jgi:hypothetical protein
MISISSGMADANTAYEKSKVSIIFCKVAAMMTTKLIHLDTLNYYMQILTKPKTKKNIINI